MEKASTLTPARSRYNKLCIDFIGCMKKGIIESLDVCWVLLHVVSSCTYFWVSCKYPVSFCLAPFGWCRNSLPSSRWSFKKLVSKISKDFSHGAGYLCALGPRGGLRFKDFSRVALGDD